MSREDDDRLIRLLSGWERGSGWLPGRLSDAVAGLIESGDLAAGDRLPAERRLASALLISRGTVTTGYRLLSESGHVQTRPGSGTVVTASAHRGRVSEGLLSSFTARDHDTTDLSSAAPTGLRLVQEAAARAMAGDDFARLVGTDGYDVRGLPSLREALADYYGRRGIPSTADDLMVTNGSQQALKMLADALVARGDVVLVEDPTYRGALEVFRDRHARIVPVPMEHDGPDVTEMERLVRALRPRVVYLLPIAHNPTGSVISVEKARAVARLLDETGTTLIEDGSPSDLVLTERIPPSVGTFMTDADWMAIGSLSKLFWGGLRVGWIRTRRPGLVSTLARVKAGDDLGGSLVSQVAGAECLVRFQEAREARRAELEQGLEVATAVLRGRAPTWQWQTPSGGGGVWVELPGTDTGRFAEFGRRRGIGLVPGPVFSATGNFTGHLRIPILREAQQLEQALDRLVDLWEAYR